MFEFPPSRRAANRHLGDARRPWVRYLFWFLPTLLLAGCAAQRPTSPTPVPFRDARPSEFELSFVGLCVPPARWEQEFAFYTQTLGVECHSRQGHWAVLGAGWEPYVQGRSRGLIWELFESSASDSWSRSPITLGIAVADLARFAGRLVQQGNAYGASDSASSALPSTRAASVNLTTPSGFPWRLWENPTAAARSDLHQPEILEVTLRVEDMPGQIRFYQRLLGLPPTAGPEPDSWVFWSHFQGPALRLVPGGHRHQRITAAARQQPALAQPAFLGFMVRDVEQSRRHLNAVGVVSLQPATHHEWGGTDCIVADADGNAVQLFILDTEHSFGSAKH